MKMVVRESGEVRGVGEIGSEGVAIGDLPAQIFSRQRSFYI